MALALSLQRPKYIQELDEQFLALWPHRFDFLYAPHPDPSSKPQWQTESRHPLSDRLIAQGAYLYGVRFGKETKYCVLDIDAGSPYHPRHDALALERLTTALEPLGLVSHLTVSSSNSGGVHLYFPFAEPLPSWQIGLAVSSLLMNRGFKVIPGWLEVFPHPKLYCPSGQMSLFNGHRLPMQQGSYLLGETLEPISISEIAFVRQWRTVTERNDIDAKVLKQVILQAQRKAYRVTQKAEKFLNDLNAEIELGWTGPGQTNRLLGRIAMRSYIFGHILDAPAPLSGEALVDDIIQVATGLPGFTTWCRHQKELQLKARHWAKSIETSQYFPYGHDKVSQKGPASNGEPSWNERQQLAARERIQQAANLLQEEGLWLAGITQRFDALVEKGISGSTLYRHRDLWHPRAMDSIASMDTPPDPPNFKSAPAEDRVGARPPQPSHKLIERVGCSTPNNKDFRPKQEVDIKGEGCNSNLRTGCDRSPMPQQLRLDIMQTLQHAQTRQEAKQQVHIKRHRAQARAEYVAQIQRWLTSDDPILIAEARSRLHSMELDP